jgi:16S rRNA (guanine966-N2)-methyltransferase
MKLRIISGELKGRRINAPDSNLIRPTTDRVRETLFNLLNNRIDFVGIKVLDVYAGSGALGFECLSRGAASVDFVEKNYVIYRNLEENIDSLDLGDRCRIYKMEAVRFSALYNDMGYNLILADPPFFKDDIYKVVSNLLSNKYLASDGSIIIERSIQTRKEDETNLNVIPFKIIGDTCLYEITY